jgi:hypothetical protein
MTFWTKLNEGSGFDTDSLTPGELAAVRAMIFDQYHAGIREASPDLTDAAVAAGLDRYHTLPIRFDHGEFWTKNRRVLPATTLPAFEAMRFFRQIRAELPSAAIYADDLMWRIVRPDEPSDVGPVHADKWFWDAGNGSIETNRERLKVWIALYTEAGLNGLSVKPESHKSDHWKRHFEYKHGKMKPVLDEDTDSLKMELLPLEAGEMVLFHDGLLHGGVVNRAATCRVSLELTITYLASEGTRLTQLSRAA